MSFIKKLFGLHDVEVSGNMHVLTLKKRFQESFGTEIRVYKSETTGKGSRLADDTSTLASICTKGKKVDTITVKKSHTVFQVENQFKELMGIGIQIMNPSNPSTFADNNSKLSNLSKSDK
jgi:hypothetical protein